MRVLIKMAMIAALLTSAVSVANDFSQGPKIVPAYASPDNKEMVFEEQVLPIPLTSEARILIANDSGIHYFKRLYMPQPASDIRIVPDDAELLDTLVTCVKIKDFPKNSYKHLSLQLDNDTGIVSARYPLEYRCSFDRPNIASNFREIAESTENSRPLMITTVRGRCEGRQLEEYVAQTIRAGEGIISISKTWGVRRAFNSDVMGYYYQGTDYIRQHDLTLKRQGCTSLMGGPTGSQLNELRQIVSEIERLAAQEAGESGLITGPYGILPSK